MSASFTDHDRPRAQPFDGDDTATAVVVANLLADLLYAWLDPRITY